MQRHNGHRQRSEQQRANGGLEPSRGIASDTGEVARQGNVDWCSSRGNAALPQGDQRLTGVSNPLMNRVSLGNSDAP
jgi:hypothetical protein